MAESIYQRRGVQATSSRADGMSQRQTGGKVLQDNRESSQQLKQLMSATSASAVQRIKEGEEPLQGQFASQQTTQLEQPAAPKPNHTGLPDNLKTGIESLSGMSMDNVRVHYNSAKPAQLNALAYAQGTDIHVASGQEQHLPHEAWHVVQQAQGRVKPTMQMKGGFSINNDMKLEREANMMGETASAGVVQTVKKETRITPLFLNVIQKAPPSNYVEKDDDTLLDIDPKKWVRPAWYNGAEGGAATIREFVWGKIPPESLTEVLTKSGETQLLATCPYCTGLVSFMGASVEHKTAWGAYAHQKGATTVKELYKWYHDMDNLIIVHSGCNASAQQKSPEQIAMRQHNPISPATWGAAPERLNIGRIIQNLKTDYEESGYSAIELTNSLDKILLDTMALIISFPNAMFKLEKLVGPEALQKADR